MDQIQSPVPEGFVGTHDTKGKLLPVVINLYQAGLVTVDQIRAKVQEMLPTFRESFFRGAYEEQVLLNALEMAIDPKIQVDTMYEMPETVEIIKELRDQGYRIVALSNFEKVAFTQLMAKFPDIFNLFDKIYLSADLQMLKPNPAIYLYVKQQEGLQDRNKFFFVDDQQENIDAAEAKDINIPAFLFTDSPALRAELIARGYLSAEDGPYVALAAAQ